MEKEIDSLLNRKEVNKKDYSHLEIDIKQERLNNINIFIDEKRVKKILYHIDRYLFDSKMDMDRDEVDLF